MKKALITVAVAVAVPAAGIFILARAVYPGNVAETRTNHEDEKLRTRIYDADLPTVLETVKQIIPTISTYGKNWKLSDSETENDAAIVKAEVPVVVFVDDLTITMQKNAGKTTVNVRSNSRIGKSDFGENRRHVLQILDALDEKFAADASANSESV